MKIASSIQQTVNSNEQSALSNQQKTDRSLFTIHRVKLRGGFTLIETLVAISVLLVSLAGPLSIASQSLQSAFYARDQITAFYLAQEAVEYVRAVRDQNYLVGSGWLNGLSECVGLDCAIDFPNFSHQSCSGQCPTVLIGETTGFFNLVAGIPSIYTRTLRVDPSTLNPDEVTVSVTVSWQSGRLERSFEVREQLFDWL